MSSWVQTFKLWSLNLCLTVHTVRVYYVYYLFYYVLSILHNKFIKYHSLTHLTDGLSRLLPYNIERDVVVPCTFVDCAKNTICVFIYKNTAILLTFLR